MIDQDTRPDDVVDNEGIREREERARREEEAFIDDGRGIPQVGRKKPVSRIWYLVFAGVFAVVLFAAAATMGLNKLRNRNFKTDDKETISAEDDPKLESQFRNAGGAPPPLPPGVDTTPVATTGTQPPPIPACLPGQQPTETAPCLLPPQAAPPQAAPVAAGPSGPPVRSAAEDLAERRKRAPLMANGLDGGSSAGAERAGAMEERGDAHGKLGAMLIPTKMGAVSAAVLPDPDMTITQGHLLPCSLETAINSDVAGMTSCVLTHNIYSTNGRVLLLERGSRVVGQYQSGQLQQGQARMFVLWTRVETPNGVVINLDSPATDALGRSGVPGHINTHFWSRFGAALLLSVIDDASQYAVARQQAQAQANANGSGTTVVTTGNSTAAMGHRAGEIAVAHSINIAPTLELAQGSSLGIFVARDLYFGDVYKLVQRASAQ